MDDRSYSPSDKPDPKQVDALAMQLLTQQAWTDRSSHVQPSSNSTPPKSDAPKEVSINLGSYGSDSEISRKVIELLSNKKEADGKNGLEGSTRTRIEELAKAPTDLDDKGLEKLAASNSEKDAVDRKAAAIFFSASAEKATDRFWLDAIGIRDTSKDLLINSGCDKGSDIGTINEPADYKAALVNKLAAAQLSDLTLADSEKNRHITAWQDTAREKFGDAAGAVSTVAALQLVSKIPGMVKLPGIAGLAVATGSAIIAGGLVNNEVAGRSALNPDGFLKNLFYGSVTIGLLNPVGRITQGMALSPQNNFRIAAGLVALGETGMGGLDLAKANVYQNAWDSALPKAAKLEALDNQKK